MSGTRKSCDRHETWGGKGSPAGSSDALCSDSRTHAQPSLRCQFQCMDNDASRHLVWWTSNAAANGNVAVQLCVCVCVCVVLRALVYASGSLHAGDQKYRLQATLQYTGDTAEKRLSRFFNATRLYLAYSHSAGTSTAACIYCKFFFTEDLKCVAKPST